MSKSTGTLAPLLGPVYWLCALGRASGTEGLRMGWLTVVSIVVGGLFWGTLLYIFILSSTYDRMVVYLSDEARPPVLAEAAMVASASPKAPSLGDGERPEAQPAPGTGGPDSGASSVKDSPENIENPLDPIDDSENAADEGKETLVPPSTPGSWEASTAQLLLENLQIDDEKAVDLLACALKQKSGTNKAATIISIPAISGIEAAQRTLLVARGGDVHCDAVQQRANQVDAARLSRRAIAQLLVGSFGCEQADLAYLLGSSDNPCADSGSRWREAVSRLRPWSERSAQWRPIALAKAMGCSESGLESVCPIVAGLFQASLDDPESRESLVRIGMAEGLGRWLVLVLAFAVVSALCWRTAAFNRMRAQISVVERAAGPTDKNENKANTAWAGLGEGAADLAAFPLSHPVAGLVREAQESHNAQNPDETNVKDAGHKIGMDMQRWWERITTLVTLFPVIGLAATLNGLIHAFSQADRIAAAMGDSRAGAIQMMVGELSASFATTFVALLAMGFLTLWIVLLQHSEQRRFEGLVDQVDSDLGYRKP